MEEPAVARLREIAARTGGPFTKAGARACGFSDARIRRLLRGGVWRPLRTGVYIDRLVLEGATNPARRHALDIAALLLTLDCRAAACGPSAARILGLDLVRPPARLTVATSADVPSRDRTGYVLRPMNLPTDHVRTRYGCL